MFARAAIVAALTVAGVTVAGVACRGEERQAWLSFPPADGASSMLLATYSRGALSVEALPRSGSAPSNYHVILSVEDASMSPTQALLYDASLDALGFAAGKVEPARAGAMAEPLPMPDRIFTLEPNTESGEPIWVSAMRVDPAIADFQRERVTGCAEFGRAVDNFTLDGNLMFVTHLQGDRTYVSTTHGDFEVARREVKRFVAVTPSRALILAAWKEAAGTFLLGDAIGHLWRGELAEDGGFENLARVRDFPARIHSIDGDRESGEFFVLSDRIYRFDGQNWDELGDPADAWGKIVWTGSGEAMMLSRSPGIVYRFAGGQRSTLMLDSSIQLTHLAQVPNLGAIAGSGQGRLYRYTDRGWTGESDADYGFWVLSIAPYEDGFIFLLASGTVVQRRTDSLCETPTFPIIQDGAIVPLDNGDLLVLAESPGEEQVKGLILPRAR